MSRPCLLFRFVSTDAHSLAVCYACETTSTLSLPTTSTSLAPITAVLDAFDARLNNRNPHYLPWILRASARDFYASDYRVSNPGFRLARALP